MVLGCFAAGGGGAGGGGVDGGDFSGCYDIGYAVLCGDGLCAGTGRGAYGGGYGDAYGGGYGGDYCFSTCLFGRGALLWVLCCGIFAAIFTDSAGHGRDWPHLQHQPICISTEVISDSS